LELELVLELGLEPSNILSDKRIFWLDRLLSETIRRCSAEVAGALEMGESECRDGPFIGETVESVSTTCLMVGAFSSDLMVGPVSSALAVMFPFWSDMVDRGSVAAQRDYFFRAASVVTQQKVFSGRPLGLHLG
jgi:hypothetical protein